MRLTPHLGITLKAEFDFFLKIILVDAFGERILVIEDDPLLKGFEMKKKQKPGCTLVLPRENWWSHQFLST